MRRLTAEIGRRERAGSSGREIVELQKKLMSKKADLMKIG